MLRLRAPTRHQGNSSRARLSVRDKLATYVNYFTAILTGVTNGGSYSPKGRRKHGTYYIGVDCRREKYIRLNHQAQAV